MIHKSIPTKSVSMFVSLEPLTPRRLLRVTWECREHFSECHQSVQTKKRREKIGGFIFESQTRVNVRLQYADSDEVSALHRLQWFQVLNLALTLVISKTRVIPRIIFQRYYAGLVFFQDKDLYSFLICRRVTSVSIQSHNVMLCDKWTLPSLFE